MIELERVSVVRGRATLLRDVTLTLAPGNLICLVGPNGAGKTTLVKLASGAISPDSGSARFCGTTLRAVDAGDLARRRAVVSQQSNIAFGFSTLEVVLLGRHPHNPLRERPSDVALARNALTRVEAAHLAERDVTTLSGGERQRVDLARALVQLTGEAPPETTALFLDEPTSNLDLAHQHAALSLARATSREGRLVVAVMHDLNLAAQYADRIVVLRAGRVVADGAPRDVLNAELVLQVFGLRALVMTHPELGCPLIVSARA